MDTDELTPKAYEVIVLAARLFDDLKTHIGASAERFRNEDHFLRGTARLLDEIVADPEGYLDSWDQLDSIEDADIPKFIEGVRKIQNHVAATLATPQSKRGSPEAF